MLTIEKVAEKLVEASWQDNISWQDAIAGNLGGFAGMAAGHGAGWKLGIRKLDATRQYAGALRKAVRDHSALRTAALPGIGPVYDLIQENQFKRLNRISKAIAKANKLPSRFASYGRGAGVVAGTIGGVGLSQLIKHLKNRKTSQ